MKKRKEQKKRQKMEKPKNIKDWQNPKKTDLKNSPEKEKTPTASGLCQESVRAETIRTRPWAEYRNCQPLVLVAYEPGPMGLHVVRGMCCG
jgi:hypothetical protein